MALNKLLYSRELYSRGPSSGEAMKLKRYLGQHFLKNKDVARKIVEAAGVNKDDIVLEVGPGKGALTKILLQKAKQVIAVEKDKELVDFLMDKFKGQKNLIVVHDDILKFSALDACLPARKKSSFGGKNYKIVANIPYYITSRFLRKFLESDYQPSLMALMVQKEVAERITAKNGKESILSISVKAYGNPRIVAKVPAKNFSPPPKVDSAIILIEDISKDFFNPSAGENKIDEKKFFRLLRLGFSHRRKLLKNNLKIDVKILEKFKIPALSRPEELTLDNWKCLYLTAAAGK